MPVMSDEAPGAVQAAPEPYTGEFPKMVMTPFGDSVIVASASQERAVLEGRAIYSRVQSAQGETVCVVGEED